MFFRNEGPVPETFRRLKANLESRGIPHIFMGATALGVHGYIRATEDVDVCMRAEDLARFRSELVGPEYQPVQGRSRRFYDPATDTTFDILVAGNVAGNSDKQKAICFPDPSEAKTIQGTPVPSLTRLIELKLVTWRLRDWADVIELIRVNALNESFAEQLHPIARQPYLECFDQMKEEDKYNAIHEPYDAGTDG
jgi:hypothetical protein